MKGGSPPKKHSPQQNQAARPSRIVLLIFAVLAINSLSAVTYYWVKDDVIAPITKPKTSIKLMEGEIPVPPDPRIGEIRIELDHPEDKDLTLTIDDYPIAIDQLSRDITLRTGNHYYRVRRNGGTIDLGNFQVKAGRSNPPIQIKTRWPKKVGT